MAKQGGMGDQFFVDGYDIGGDVGALSTIATPRTTTDVTPITKEAFERLLLLRDGQMGFTSFFNDQNSAPLGAFQVLKALPTTDRQCTYLRGTTIGKPSASLVSKQINYDLSRPQDGSLTFATDAQANGYGLEWGEQLTAGKRTDTGATNGSSLDGAASTSFGWAMYVHLVSFTGTSVTITVEDSADNAAWATLSGATTGALAAIGAARVASSSITATVRRYLRVATTGTFSNAAFIVGFVRYLTAQS